MNFKLYIHPELEITQYIFVCYFGITDLPSEEVWQELLEDKCGVAPAPHQLNQRSVSTL